MSAIAGLIDQVAIGLYVVIAVAFLWYLQKWSAARYAIRATSFELERDYARGLVANALTALVLLAEAAAFVVGVQTVVVPQIREDRDMREAALAAVTGEVMVDDGFATPTLAVPENNPRIVDPVDPSVLGGAQVRDVVATPTNTPTLVGTIEPNAPAPIGCDTPNAFLQVPANGMRVFQQTPVIGTAFVDDFSEYKIEIRGPGIPQFAPIDQGTIPLRELGALSQFNPALYEPGTYQFRLMVFDSTTNLRASCQVTIYVSQPPLTATPIPTVQPGAGLQPVAPSPSPTPDGSA